VFHLMSQEDRKLLLGVHDGEHASPDKNSSPA
jgi:hypothetical protein